MEKKLRFGDLVRNSGRPEMVTLWTDPTKDSRLAKAQKENRVLTVIQQQDHRKPFGVIGFKPEAGNLYVIFPQPLPKREDARVIGINYELLEQPVAAKPIGKKKVAAKVRRIEQKPAKKRFNIVVRRVASVENKVQVEALDKSGAEHQALEETKGRPFDLERAKVHEEVVRTES
jgi:hypothetical protein